MSVGWKFSRSSTDEGKSGGNPSEYAFDHDVKDFVRETLQNSNDAGKDREGPVEVTYRLSEFTGDDLTAFQSALQWRDDDVPEGDDARESLESHFETVAEANTDTTLSHVVEEVEEDDRLVVVTVEDANTCGLYGEETGGGPYSALVLDELITQKEGGGGSGGSYGLGKAVLWSWSGLSTVAFCSVPEDTGGRSPPRLIVRTQLPSHDSSDDGVRYEGSGFFGQADTTGRPTAIGTDGDDVLYKWGDENNRPHSLWGDGAASVADALGVDRPSGTTGTSISILGFAEPGSNSQSDPEEIADQIAWHASKWFWPAMLSDSLNVTVETPERRFDVAPDRCEQVAPFIDCVVNRNSTREVLDQPGDIGRESVRFEIEDKQEGPTGEAGETTESGPVDVYARLADPSGDTQLSNRVALVRGAGMVVKYYDRNRVVYGGRTFHGVVLAGRARPWTDTDPTEADGDIDDYLQAAEPPKHNDWTDTKNLKSTYGSGARGTITDLQRELITDAIRDLVRQTRGDGRLVAGRLAERLNIPDGRREIPGEDDDDDGDVTGIQTIQGTSEISYDHSADHWEFSGRISVVREDFEVWEARLILEQVDEENKVVGRIPVDRLTSPSDDQEGVYVDDSGDVALLRAHSEVDTLSFRGFSVYDEAPYETRIQVKGNVYMRRDDR